MNIDYNPGSSSGSGRASWHGTSFAWWDDRAIMLHVITLPSRTRDREMLAYRMNTVARDFSLPFHVIVSYRQMYVVPHADDDTPIPFQRDETGALAVTIPR